ncbi:hypothetical protein [uncultured Cohaesibacter sp.]|uniref:hypothetical protein n=1 Tax=uncultured Cohaesibacter sp. TaxID=1002546 RepID=UPI0029C7D6D3|nr:hypothetical protein [uncultured Cohaesibacter sp.]
MTTRFRSLMSHLVQTLVCLFLLLAPSSAAEPTATPAFKDATKASVAININKIYEFNELNETYVIDGYLVVSWKDKALAERMRSGVALPDIYENDAIDDLKAEGIRIPAIEFINVVGDRSVANRQVVTSADGTVLYNERFQATFSTAMDFRKFPFDTQKLAIELESFSFDKTHFEFVNPKVYPELVNQEMLAEWNIVDKQVAVTDQDYSHLTEDGSKTEFSRYNLTITLERKCDYYIWNFMLPLILIITSSWCVFWVDDFLTNISIAFTLMLTVVAFTFQATSLLPRLPYTTFMGMLTILGYLSIFASMVVIIAAELLSRKSEAFDKARLMRMSRYLYPLSIVLIIAFEVRYFNL